MAEKEMQQNKRYNGNRYTPHGTEDDTPEKKVTAKVIPAGSSAKGAVGGHGK